MVQTENTKGLLVIHTNSLPILNVTYKIKVRPIVEYAAPVWDPHTLVNINKLESIQRTAF